MAIDLGASNATRYHSVPVHTDFVLPSIDWTWLALVYPQSTTDTKYFISTGLYAQADSFNLLVHPTSTGNGVAVKVTSLAEATVTTPITHDKWSWIYATRRSGQLYAGQILVGGASAVESAGVAISASYPPPLGPYIGSRSDAVGNRMWKGRWGQVAFIYGSGITSEQAVELAKGVPILGMSLAKNIRFLLHGRTASYATIPDIAGSKIATRFGTSFGTNQEDAQTPHLWGPAQVSIIADAGTSHNLTIANNSSVGTLSAGTIAQTHILVPGNVSQADSVSSLSITLAGTLTVANLASSSSLSTGAVSQIHSLSLANVATSAVVSTVVIGLSGLVSLSISGLTAASSISAFALQQTHELAFDPPVTNSALDSVVITVLSGGTLTVTDLTSGGILSSLGITIALNTIWTAELPTSSSWTAEAPTTNTWSH